MFIEKYKKIYVIIFIIFFVISLLLTYQIISNNTFRNKKGIRICSWNVEWFGLPNYKGVFNNTNLGLYDKIVQHLYSIKYYIDIIKPDIICLQEVASVETANILHEYLIDYDMYSDTTIITHDKQYNLYLVRRSIPVTFFKVLDDKHKIIRLIFKYNSEEISLYNVHLRSDYSGDNSNKRTQQTKMLYEYIKSVNDNNVIITGDTNASSGSKELNILENNFINLIFSRKCNINIIDKYSLWYDKNNNDIITSDEIFLVDYFFTSQNIYKIVDQMYIYHILYQKIFSEMFKINSNKISDHYPIILDLM